MDTDTLFRVAERLTLELGFKLPNGWDSNFNGNSSQAMERGLDFWAKRLETWGVTDADEDRLLVAIAENHPYQRFPTLVEVKGYWASASGGGQAGFGTSGADKRLRGREPCKICKHFSVGRITFLVPHKARLYGEETDVLDFTTMDCPCLGDESRKAARAFLAGWASLEQQLLHQNLCKQADWDRGRPWKKEWGRRDEWPRDQPEPGSRAACRMKLYNNMLWMAENWFGVQVRHGKPFDLNPKCIPSTFKLQGDVFVEPTEQNYIEKRRQIAQRQLGEQF